MFGMIAYPGSAVGYAPWRLFMLSHDVLQGLLNGVRRQKRAFVDEKPGWGEQIIARRYATAYLYHQAREA